MLDYHACFFHLSPYVSTTLQYKPMVLVNQHTTLETDHWRKTTIIFRWMPRDMVQKTSITKASRIQTEITLLQQSWCICKQSTLPFIKLDSTSLSWSVCLQEVGSGCLTALPTRWRLAFVSSRFFFFRLIITWLLANTNKITINRNKHFNFILCTPEWKKG